MGRSVPPRASRTSPGAMRHGAPLAAQPTKSDCARSLTVAEAEVADEDELKRAAGATCGGAGGEREEHATTSTATTPASCQPKRTGVSGARQRPSRGGSDGGCRSRSPCSTATRRRRLRSRRPAAPAGDLLPRQPVQRRHERLVDRDLLARAPSCPNCCGSLMPITGRRRRARPACRSGRRSR